MHIDFAVLEKESEYLISLQVYRPTGQEKRWCKIHLSEGLWYIRLKRVVVEWPRPGVENKGAD